VTMLSGIVGVPLGMFLSTSLKKRFPRADPVICGTGLFISAVFLTLGMLVCRKNIILSFILLFIGEVALNLNWSIVADILLYVVVPTCRSTAEAVQILASHAFGDAGSPYLIGVIADGMKGLLDTTGEICKGTENDFLFQGRALNSTTSLGDLSLVNGTLLESSGEGITASPLGVNAAGDTEISQSCALVDFQSMLYSLLLNSGVEILGGLFFLLTAIFIIRDKLACEQAAIESRKEDVNEIKMMLAQPSPEESLGDYDEDGPSDDDLPQLIRDSRSNTPV